MRQLRDHLKREELRRIWRHYVLHSDRTPQEEADWHSHIGSLFVSLAAVVWTLLIRSP